MTFGRKSRSVLSKVSLMKEVELIYPTSVLNLLKLKYEEDQPSENPYHNEFVQAF